MRLQQKFKTITPPIGYPIVLRENFLKIKTGHLFSIAKLNFESICFLAFFDLRPFKLVHRPLKFLAFLHSENEVKICKIDKMAKNHFSRAEKGSQGV